MCRFSPKKMTWNVPGVLGSAPKVLAPQEGREEGRKGHRLLQTLHGNSQNSHQDSQLWDSALAWKCFLQAQGQGEAASQTLPHPLDSQDPIPQDLPAPASSSSAFPTLSSPIPWTKQDCNHRSLSSRFTLRD